MSSSDNDNFEDAATDTVTATTPELTTTTTTIANNNREVDNDDHHGSNNNNNNNTSSSSGGTSSSGCSLLTCSFNQDGGCLAIGTSTGFSVHNLYPHYAVTVDRSSLQGGIGYIEMLFRCNLIAFVGGGPQPYSPSHRVLIWDDHIPKEIGELSFRQTVLCVKLRKDSVAVALRDRIYVYHLADLSLRDKIYTADNPHGLLCLSTQINDMILACPSVTAGHVRCELYGLRKTVLMEAHESSLRALALTSSGQRLATCSTKGTIIRIFDVLTTSCIQQFRRGYERTTITCLAWSWNDMYLACTSDKGTTHIFYHNKNKNHHGSSSSNQQQQKSNGNEEKKTNYNHNSVDPASSSSSSSPGGQNGGGKSSSSSSLSYMSNYLFNSVRISMEGDDITKSFVQIRGIPHPQACSFISEATTTPTIAIAGFDHDNNGVLLICEFQHPNTMNNNNNNNFAGSNGHGSIGTGTDYYNNNMSSHQHNRDHSSSAAGNNNNNNNEPVRIGYHVICPSSTFADENAEEKRRRRMRGWTPDVHSKSTSDDDGTAGIGSSSSGQQLHVGDRTEVSTASGGVGGGDKEAVTTAMDQIVFDDDIDEFVTVTAIKPSRKPQQQQQQQQTNDSTSTSQLQQQQQLENNNNSDDDVVPIPTGGGAANNNNNNISTSTRSNNGTTAASSSLIHDSGTVSDSVRTEPLDEYDSSIAVVDHPCDDGTGDGGDGGGGSGSAAHHNIPSESQ